MLPRVLFLALAFAFLATSFSGSAGEKKPAENVAEMKIQFRLNALESAILMDHYATNFKRQLDLQNSVRATVRTGDERMPQYQRAEAEARADLEQTKKKLIILESEKAKFIERLGAKNAAEESSGNSARISRILEQILDRLTIMDKRLQKLEREK